MKTTHIGCIVAIALSMASPSAHALMTLDAVIPPSPMAGETVSVRISTGICDAIVDAKGFPQITRADNVIRMLFETVHYDDPNFCSIGLATMDWPLGAFPAGTYTLQLDRHYVDFIGHSHTETVGTQTFTVRGETPAPVALPTLNWANLLGLALGIVAAVNLALNRRRTALSVRSRCGR